jgi:putative hydrolase of the HAD superfamily
MIKAVLFDFGGVLSEAGKVGAIREIFANVYGIDPNTINEPEVRLKALKGQITDQQFLDYMNKRYASSNLVTKARFVKTVDQMLRCEPVYQLAKTLHQHGLKTGILSNIFTMSADSLKARGMYDNFDPVLLSCQVGYAKPEPEIYALAVRTLGVKPQEILLIDDQQHCLDPARAMGMHVILAQDPEQIVHDTRMLLQKENNLSL